jgi:hypothetical protein
MNRTGSLRVGMLLVLFGLAMTLPGAYLLAQPQAPAAAGDSPASATGALSEPTAGACAAPEPDSVSPRADSRVKVAIKAVLASAEFTPEEKILMPVRKKKVQAEEDTSDWMRWLEAFFRTFSKVLRAGIWVLAALGLLLVAFTLHYWWRMAARHQQSAPVSVPTHVGGLDIRRESLPAHISAAARLRAEAGDAAGCLSLLYRGALSALVTHFACRILSSSTEDECVRQARAHVPAATHSYFARLTQGWQLTVYAGRQPGQPVLLALCDEFDSHFALPVQAAAFEDRRDLAAAGVR